MGVRKVEALLSSIPKSGEIAFEAPTPPCSLNFGDDLLRGQNFGRVYLAAPLLPSRLSLSTINACRDNFYSVSFSIRFSSRPINFRWF
jgi:hypothetical protein